jgi:hypothetical protein
MCKADMTPFPVIFSPALGGGIPFTNVEHSCRNFSKLHKWAKEHNSHIKETVFQKEKEIIGTSVSKAIWE